MHANGTMFCTRCNSDLVVTTDLGGMERTEGGPHRVEAGVETTAEIAGVETKVETATKQQLKSFLPPEYLLVYE